MAKLELHFVAASLLTLSTIFVDTAGMRRRHAEPLDSSSRPEKHQQDDERDRENGREGGAWPSAGHGPDEGTDAASCVGPNPDCRDANHSHLRHLE